MLELQRLSKSFGDTPVFHNIGFTLARGEIVALVGESGVGKSTLLNCIAGLERADRGRLMLDGQDLSTLGEDARARLRRAQLGFVFQAFHVLPHLSVAENVSLPLLLLGRPDAARVAAMLDAVGLGSLAARMPAQLSGGQLQRTLFARLMLQDAPILLLDEPFSAIDQRTCADLLALLQGWQRQGKTVLAVLHDLHQVREAFPETLMLARELVGWGPTARVLTPANLQRLRAMPEAFDERAPVCEVEGAGTGHDGHMHVLPHGHEHVHESGHAHAHGHAPAPHTRPLPRGAREQYP